VRRTRVCERERVRGWLRVRVRERECKRSVLWWGKRKKGKEGAATKENQRTKEY